MRKNIIRLTEGQLKQIVTEAIRKVLEGNSKLAHNIDIAQIPIEILRRGYFDYRLVPTSSMYGNVLYEPVTIKEAVGNILPPDSVTHGIIQKYNLPNELVLKIENYHKVYVYVITAVIGENDKVIENDMNKMGYFLSVKGDIVVIDDMKFQVLQFEPSSQLQEDISDLVKSKFNVLYHWTPSYNVENIQRYGLIPSHKNEMFNYPPRTYLMNGDSSDEEMWALGQELCVKNSDPNNKGEYTIIIVNIENLDDNIRFFHDPNSAIGIFTEDPIPNNNIQIGKTVRFHKTLKSSR